MDKDSWNTTHCSRPIIDHHFILANHAIQVSVSASADKKKGEREGKREKKRERERERERGGGREGEGVTATIMDVGVCCAWRGMIGKHAELTHWFNRDYPIGPIE